MNLNKINLAQNSRTLYCDDTAQHFLDKLMSMNHDDFGYQDTVELDIRILRSWISGYCGISCQDIEQLLVIKSSNLETALQLFSVVGN